MHDKRNDKYDKNKGLLSFNQFKENRTNQNRDKTWLNGAIEWYNIKILQGKMNYLQAIHKTK